MKVFTGIILFLNEDVSSFTIWRLFFSNANCISYTRTNETIVAYYRNPVDVARIMEQSRSFHYKICFAGESYNKFSRKTLTISRNCHMAFGIIEKNKGNIIYEQENIIVVKFKTFLKTCKVLQRLKNIKIKVQFTSRSDIRAIQIMNPV